MGDRDRSRDRDEGRDGERDSNKGRSDDEEKGKLFIGNLSYDVRDKDLEEMFEKHGPIKELKVILDRDTGRSKGFAFITFENPGDADAAKEALNGEDLLGRQIRVDNSTPKGQGPSRGGGGGGGGRYGGGGGNNFRGSRGGYERNDDRRGGGNYGSRDGKDSRSRDDRGSGRDRSERSKY